MPQGRTLSVSLKQGLLAIRKQISTVGEGPGKAPEKKDCKVARLETHRFHGLSNRDKSIRDIYKLGQVVGKGAGSGLKWVASINVGWLCLGSWHVYVARPHASPAQLQHCNTRCVGADGGYVSTQTRCCPSRCIWGGAQGSGPGHRGGVLLQDHSQGCFDRPDV